VVVTLSICSNSVHLQVCILISEAKHLFSEKRKTMFEPLKTRN